MSLEENLKQASYLGHLEAVKEFVAQGADIHSDDNLALAWAALRGHLPVVQYLVEQGADIHAADDCALRWAKSSRNTDVVAYVEACIQKEQRRRTIECL